MSDIVSVTLTLVGPYAGKTMRLNGYGFSNGRIQITGSVDQVKGACDYLRKCYGAYVEGSTQLKQAQEQYQKLLEGQDNELQSDVQTGGQEIVEENTENEEFDEGEKEGSEVHTEEDGSGENGTPVNEKLKQAVLSLNVNNDEHWTRSGKPVMEAIQAVYGSADVTRKDVEEVLPGYTREKAKEVQNG